MRDLVIGIMIVLAVAGSVVFVIRFSAEYRKVKREQRRIRATGRTKGAIRAMRRDLARLERTKKTSK